VGLLLILNCEVLMEEYLLPECTPKRLAGRTLKTVSELPTHGPSASIG
jgi:hypothetical protein